MSNPKKWTEVYPYGTKEGDEEAKFFRALARHPKFDYRSTGAIMKATNLSRQRVEEIIDKYVNKVSPPLLFAHPSNDDHWGYWERCKDRLKDDKRDISKKDKDSRVDKHIAGTPSMVGSTGVQSPTLQSLGLISDFDLFTKFLGYSEDEANKMVALQEKLLAESKDLEQIKLQVIAENPVGLMVMTGETVEPLDAGETLDGIWMKTFTDAISEDDFLADYLSQEM